MPVPLRFVIPLTSTLTSECCSFIRVHQRWRAGAVENSAGRALVKKRRAVRRDGRTFSFALMRRRISWMSTPTDDMSPTTAATSSAAMVHNTTTVSKGVSSYVRSSRNTSRSVRMSSKVDANSSRRTPSTNSARRRLPPDEPPMSGPHTHVVLDGVYEMRTHDASSTKESLPESHRRHCGICSMPGHVTS